MFVIKRDQVFSGVVNKFFYLTSFATLSKNLLVMLEETIKSYFFIIVRALGVLKKASWVIRISWILDIAVKV